MILNANGYPEIPELEMSVDQVLSAGTKIATIAVDETSTDVYAKPSANITSATVTLNSSNWSNNSQTVSVTGLTANSVISVTYAPSDKTDFINADVYYTDKGNGTLTFKCNNTPSTNIDVNILILG